ncbi:MAG: hypothetical protein Harvfovirus4_5 [Harvfovirus sp.]|uniref:Uncharacterized protein n=1 Tax=Harvfovirus sp. TaxID=2487768 RepID=A0A3G5A385_9VIRU|nr:MAG: hypothetical protein Harvfovirus4_5 [Harvfovirus sp.]
MGMKEVIIEKKFVDHTMKTKRCHAFYICIDKEIDVTKEVVDRIVALVHQKIEPFIGDYKYVCDHEEAKVHHMMVDGVKRQAKVCKKLCYVFAKGEAPCNKAEYFKYKHEEGTHDGFKFNGSSLEYKPNRSLMAMAGNMPAATAPKLMMGGHGDHDEDMHKVKYQKYKDKYLQLKRMS